MINPDVTFFVQLINFIIILILLNLILIKPIRNIIKKRKETVSGMVGETESFVDSAEAKLKHYQEALAEAHKAGTQTRNALKDEAASEEKALVEGASKQAQQTIESARADVAQQAKAAMDTLKSQVSQLAEQAASRILA